MITIYIGQKNTPYEKLKKELLQKTGNMVEFIDRAEQTVDGISTMATTASLFGDIKLYIASGIDPQVLNDVLEVCAYSENYFLVILDTITAPIKKKLQKIMDNIPTDYVSIIETQAEKKPEKINPFLIANTMASLDKKKLWTVLMQLRHAGIEPENTMGIMFWKYKDLITKGVDTENNIRRMGKLVHMYHHTRKNGLDMYNALEIFILNLS